MIYIVGGIAAWCCLVMFAMTFNHGAHRKENPREFRSEYWQ